MKNSKKGFTLIELLAVIVILAILVAVAIPAITRYLNTARKGTYATNAQAAISAVRNDIITQGITVDSYYTIENVNKLMDKKLETSPYGIAYDQKNSYVKVVFNNGNAGFNGTGSTKETAESDLKEENVKTGQSVTCTLPTDASPVTP